MARTVSSLCKDKFEPLLDYIDDSITIDDLHSFDDPEETLTRNVPPKQKLLMQLFYAQRLQPLLDTPDPFESEHNDEDSKTIKSEDPFEPIEGRIKLQDRIVSAKLKNLFVSPPKDIIFTDALLEGFQNMAIDKRKEITSFDISRNNLTDEDGETIYSIVSLLTECTEVDLSLNRIQGRETNWLLKLLRLHQIDWVNITINAIASVDCKEFFQNLKKSAEDKVLYEKLIWIPESWIKGNGWRTMIQDEDFEKEIVVTHTTYYSIQHK